MNWVLKKFDELSIQELYSVLQLRQEVFIIEQNCIYPDLDDKDQDSIHLMCFDKDNLIAYTRILPPGISYTDPSIGRVVTAPSVRKSGIGKELMRRTIDHCITLYGIIDITLSAQVYLIKFYESLNFCIVGDIYLEDGIDHIKMTRKASR